MDRYKWSRLSPRQLSRYAKYLVEMEFALQGFDIDPTKVGDKGIDFVIRKESKEDEGVTEYRYYDVKAKPVRGMNYIYIPKEKLTLRDNLLVVIGLFEDGDLPRSYLIPATEWTHPNALLVDRDYEGLKSKPEYGLNISKRNLPLLEPYRFERTVGYL